MKTFIQTLFISFCIIFFLLSLPYILPAKVEITYKKDSDLRARAFQKGLKANPSTLVELKKILKENNQNMSAKRINLGKELFYDTTLSKHNDLACVSCHWLTKDIHAKNIVLNKLTEVQEDNSCLTCHLKDQSGSDRRQTSLGHDKIQNPKHLNSISVLNSSLAKYLTWSGEVKTMQEQVKNSILGKYKLNITKEELLKRLKNDTKYITSFKEAFKNDKEPLSFLNIQEALTSYINTLLTRSSFDLFLEGDDNAISKQAKRGLVNFLNYGCSGCHTGRSVGGQNIQRFPLRNFAGIHDLRPNFNLFPKLEIIDNSFPFPNTGGYKGRANTQFFKVPILRNVTKTSPYFHNGAVSKLKEAVQIMARHQLGKNLQEKKLDEILAFLKTLEGKRVVYKINEEERK